MTLGRPPKASFDYFRLSKRTSLMTKFVLSIELEATKLAGRGGNLGQLSVPILLLLLLLVGFI